MRKESKSTQTRVWELTGIEQRWIETETQAIRWRRELSRAEEVGVGAQLDTLATLWAAFLYTESQSLIQEGWLIRQPPAGLDQPGTALTLFFLLPYVYHNPTEMLLRARLCLHLSQAWLITITQARTTAGSHQLPSAPISSHSTVTPLSWPQRPNAVTSSLPRSKLPLLERNIEHAATQWNQHWRGS